MKKSFFTILESDVIFDNRLSNTEKILYAVICNYANNEKGYCYLSYRQLAEIMSLKKRQFYNCIETLKKYNYIITIKKTTRNYIKPTVNLMLERRENFKKLVDYDWLNEDLED